MHKTIILWISAIVITFLAGYIYNITDKDYPVTGTIGVEGKKVSYMLEKIHYGPDDFSVIIRTDIPDLAGKIKWRNINNSEYWYEAQMRGGEKVLIGEIPLQSPLKQIEYKILLSYNDREYELAGGMPVPLKFYSKVPVPVKFFNGFLIYLILFLAVRTGLESFSANQKIKKYSFVTVTVTLLFTAMIHPLYLSYKYGYINNQIPPIGNLFPWYSILFLVVWIVFTVSHFKVENPKPFAAASMLITIAVYLLVRF
jgi:hypothetical protein